MILLDTNVLSAVMAVEPPPKVLAWLDAQPTEALHLSTITLAEIGFGLSLLAPGRRRRDLEARFEAFVQEGFAHRVLSFDLEAARHCGPIMGHRRETGRPVSALDGQIAAIARAHGLAVATRNVRDFADCGVEVVNPFE